MLILKMSCIQAPLSSLKDESSLRSTSLQLCNLGFLSFGHLSFCFQKQGKILPMSLNFGGIKIRPCVCFMCYVVITRIHIYLFD